MTSPDEPSKTGRSYFWPTIGAVVALIIVAFGVAAAVYDPGDPDPFEEDRAILDRFESMLEVGANCDTLYSIRNEADPGSFVVETMNEQLREIGCFSSSSERTDQE